MEISDDFSMHAAVTERDALDELYRAIEQASDLCGVDALTLVDLSGVADFLSGAMSEVSCEIQDREQALSVYREADVQEVAHRESLRTP